jgi:hypothetical protein
MKEMFKALVAILQKGKKLFVGLAVILAVLIVFVFISISSLFLESNVSKPINGGYGVVGRGATVSPQMSKAQNENAYSAGDVVSFYNPTLASTPGMPKEKRIIKNGALSLLVKNADDSVAKINSIAETNGGFAENSNVYEISEGVKSGSITVRVPSKNFVGTMEAIKGVAVKVESASINSNDVTAEYVDLEAQIKNYKTEEIQYQEIMSRASKIQDVLDVASRLADVRGRIERTQGQLNYLARQVDMSTISVSLTAEPEVKVFGIVWRPLTVLKQSIKGLVSDLTGFVDWLIQFLFKIPIYILRIVVAFFIVWLIWVAILWVKRKIWG